MKIWFNGKFVDKEKAKVSVFDHGLLYGDGVFEGIRAYEGHVFRLKEHLDRLYNSARAIWLKIPLSRKQLMEAILAAIRKNKLRDAYIRLVVTRGVGDLGIDPRKCYHKPSIFIIADKISLYPKEYCTNGLKIITATVRRNSPNAIAPHIKSLNYLNNILAKIEAIKAGVPEAIMLNEEKQVVECTGDNIFILKKNILISPPTQAGALPGITCEAVIELARRKLKIPTKRCLFKMNHVYNADECFLTGTAAEVIPVVKVDEKKIGSGKPGKVTRRLMQEFSKLTKSTGVAIY